MTHPELFIRIEVAACSPEEAQREAWRRWYRRPVRDDLDELMRAAFSTVNTGRPVHEEEQSKAGEADSSAP